MGVEPDHDALRRRHRHEGRLLVDRKTVALGLTRKRTGRALGIALKRVEAKPDAIDKRGIFGRLAAIGGSEERLGPSNPGRCGQHAQNRSQHGEQANRFP